MADTLSNELSRNIHSATKTHTLTHIRTPNNYQNWCTPFICAHRQRNSTLRTTNNCCTIVETIERRRPNKWQSQFVSHAFASPITLAKATYCKSCLCTSTHASICCVCIVATTTNDRFVCASVWSTIFAMLYCYALYSARTFAGSQNMFSNGKHAVSMTNAVCFRVSCVYAECIQKYTCDHHVANSKIMNGSVRCCSASCSIYKTTCDILPSLADSHRSQFPHRTAIIVAMITMTNVDTETHTHSRK